MNILVYSSILVKNPPASGDAVDVSSLGWEDPLEKGMGSQSSILAWRIPWTEEMVGHSPRGLRESETELSHTYTYSKGDSP